MRNDGVKDRSRQGSRGEDGGRGVQAQRKNEQDHVSPQDQPGCRDLCGPKPRLKESELSTSTDAPKHMAKISLGKRHHGGCFIVRQWSSNSGEHPPGVA